MVGTLGFVNFDSPFLLAGPTDRRYPTWLISAVGGIGRSSVFRAVGLDPCLKNFSLALMDFGFRGAQLGICPYSEPELLAVQIPEDVLSQIQERFTTAEMATLICRNYGKKWLPFWLIGNLLFDHSFPLLGTLKGSMAKRGPSVDTLLLEELRPQLSTGPMEPALIDVIVPTLNRPEHVLNLLQDLSSQSIVPSRVIIIEQSPNGEPSVLDDVVQRHWPFEVKHRHVTGMGVCRARNLGLQEVQGDWALLLDDDLRLPPHLISYLLKIASAYVVDVVTAGIYLSHQNPHEVTGPQFPRLWQVFAGGASLLSRPAIEGAGAFDERMEGGYGEDYEYGIRLRQKGTNILYAPREPILHLKAPSGGYRYTFPHPWLNDKIQPKPSPTVLYSRHKHATRSMRKGYQLFYWLNRLATTPVYRWPLEIIMLTKQWYNAARWSSWLALRPSNN